MKVECSSWTIRDRRTAYKERRAYVFVRASERASGSGSYAVEEISEHWCSIAVVRRRGAASFGESSGLGAVRTGCTSADAHRGACGGEGAPENDLSAVASVRFALTLTYNFADLCKIFTACLDVRYLNP